MNDETARPTPMDPSASRPMAAADSKVGRALPSDDRPGAWQGSDPSATLLSTLSEPLGSALAPVFRQVSKASFGFALFCFFLPFFSVSCPGGEFVFSGTDLLVGAEIEEQRFSGEGLAWIAAICAVTGLGLTFTRASGTLNLAAIFGGLGVFSLSALILKFSRTVRQQTEGLASVDANAGFFLCLLSLVAAGLLAGAAAKGMRSRRH